MGVIDFLQMIIEKLMKNINTTFFRKKGCKKLLAAVKSPKILAQSLREINSPDFGILALRVRKFMLSFRQVETRVGSGRISISTCSIQVATPSLEFSGGDFTNAEYPPPIIPY